MKKIIIIGVLLLLAAVGLAPAPTAAAPPLQFGGTQVTINNPANGMSFGNGQTIGIASTSNAPGGISFVQLFVDGGYIATSTPPGGAPQPNFYVVQYWTTTPGTHTILVKATSSQNVTGQASININVQTPSATNTPNPCVAGARLVGDPPIPNRDNMAPGTPFQKTWQVQNTGSCIWISSYTLQNISGGSWSAPSPTNVPYTQPNQTANITLNMIAPQGPGTYETQWQLTTPYGYRFDPVLRARITVTQGGCNGTPQISSFYASPSTIQKGQSTTLYWGQVYNANQVRLQTPAGSSPVTAPGQNTFAPQYSTTYILTAMCNAQRVDSAVTINVTNPLPPTPTPPPSQNYIFLGSAQQAGFGAINVPVQYSYDNQGAPGRVQINALNSYNQVVGTSTVGAIPFSPQSTMVTVSVPSGIQNAVTVNGCLIDRTGNQLTCGSAIGIRQ